MLVKIIRIYSGIDTDLESQGFSIRNVFFAHITWVEHVVWEDFLQIVTQGSKDLSYYVAIIY